MNTVQEAFGFATYIPAVLQRSIDGYSETYEQNRDRVQRGVESIRNTAERTMGQVRSTANDVASKAGDYSSTGSSYNPPSSQAV